MRKILTVLVVLMIIMTLLLDNSIAAEKANVKKDKTNTSKQKQTPVGKKPIEKYDLNPIDLTVTMLPPNYAGHNLKSIYEALKKRKEKVEKGEYESTEQYKQRIQELEHKPLIGGLTVNDLYSFVVTPNSTYNADFQTLTLMIREASVFEGVAVNSSVIGIDGPKLYLEESTYIGSNAYGAATVVKKSRKSYIDLAFSNKSALLSLIKQDDYNSGTFEFELGKITPETAKAIRDNIRVVFIYNLEEPYLLSEGYVRVDEPTINYPYDDLTVLENVFAISQEIWIFNKTNGEILLKVKTGD